MAWVDAAQVLTPVGCVGLAQLHTDNGLITAVEAAALLATTGRLVSVGHTNAGEQQFDAVVAAGARLTTHLFNAMSGIHHRSPGVATFALTNPAVCASLIADGVHVHPRVLRLAFTALGRDRAVLVTDAVVRTCVAASTNPARLLGLHRRVRRPAAAAGTPALQTRRTRSRTHRPNGTPLRRW